MSAFGLELNKATLLGHLFADFHFVLEKREKGNTVIVSVQLIMSIWRIRTVSHCVSLAPSSSTLLRSDHYIDLTIQANRSAIQVNQVARWFCFVLF